MFSTLPVLCSSFYYNEKHWRQFQLALPIAAIFLFSRILIRRHCSLGKIRFYYFHLTSTLGNIFINIWNRISGRCRQSKNPTIFFFLYARLETGRIMWLGNFSFVYWIVNKLGHMIPLWEGKNLIYFGVIRSKVKVTVTINIFFDNRVVPT
jgi:hypothetical protein